MAYTLRRKCTICDVTTSVFRSISRSSLERDLMLSRIDTTVSAKVYRMLETAKNTKSFIICKSHVLDTLPVDVQVPRELQEEPDTPSERRFRAKLSTPIIPITTTPRSVYLTPQSLPNKPCRESTRDTVPPSPTAFCPPTVLSSHTVFFSPPTVPSNPTVPPHPYSSFDPPSPSLLSAPLSPSTPLSSRSLLVRRRQSTLPPFPSSPAKKASHSKDANMDLSDVAMELEPGTQSPPTSVKKPAPLYNPDMLRSTIAQVILAGQSSLSSPLPPSSNPSTVIPASDLPQVASRENWNKIGFVILACLEQFFSRCLNCRGHLKGKAKATFCGTCPIVTWQCYDCGTGTWHGQKMIEGGKSYEVNHDAATAMHAHGMRHRGVKGMMDLMNVSFISQKTYHKNLNAYSVPAGLELRDEMMDVWLDTVKTNNSTDNITLAFDAQFDSPGHCAKIGKVDAVEVHTGLCLDAQILENTETEGISCRMEKVGMGRSITILTKKLEEKGLKLAEVVTDQSVSVQTFMRQTFPAIAHLLDHWHLKRNINKAMKKGKRKAFRDLNGLVARFNRIWYVALEKSNGDPLKMKEIVNSFLLHVIGKHTFTNDPRFTLVKECLHGRLSRKDRPANLSPSSPAYKALVEIIMDPKQQEAISRVALNKTTSLNEVFHMICLIYTSKRIWCDKRMYIARTAIAQLHYNSIMMARLEGRRAVKHIKEIEKKGRGVVRKKTYTGGMEHEWRVQLMRKGRECLRNELSARKEERRKKKEAQRKTALSQQDGQDSDAGDGSEEDIEEETNRTGDGELSGDEFDVRGTGESGGEDEPIDSEEECGSELDESSPATKQWINKETKTWQMRVKRAVRRKRRETVKNTQVHRQE